MHTQSRGGEEEFTVYSSSTYRDGLCSVLLILLMEEAAYLQNRGQGAQHVLHCKVEDKE